MFNVHVSKFSQTPFFCKNWCRSQTNVAHHVKTWTPNSSHFPSRKFQDSAECAECSTEAMGLGLEALNAALSCAEVRGGAEFLTNAQWAMCFFQQLLHSFGNLTLDTDKKLMVLVKSMSFLTMAILYYCGINVKFKECKLLVICWWFWWCW